MGIPTFFRSILQNNKKIIFGASCDYPVDYFFIDFNSLIYNTWNQIRGMIKDPEDIHNQLINHTILKTIHMVNDIVKPKKYVYLSMDGVAPRAKAVQQRSRRFKSVQLKAVLKKKREELHYHDTVDWDPSPNICPGTIFMEKLCSEIVSAMKKKRFHARVYFSDSNVPGEGEHKFLKYLRKLNEDNETKDDRVVVYSPDGDMISLSLLTHKKNIFIMRIPDELSPHEMRFCNDFEYIYCDLNRVRDDFFTQLTKTYNDGKVDELSVLNDYNFLLFMVGNDFIPSLPFLKIRFGGLNTLIRIYNEIRPEMSNYLIDYHPITQKHPKINMEFFTRIILRLSQMENKEMLKEHLQAEKELAGGSDARRLHQEKDLDEYQIFESRYQHLPFFNPHHPEHQKYSPLIHKINYSLPKHQWKAQYYEYFCGMDGKSIIRYNDERTKMVMNFLESLVFTLRYYLVGCPCYGWHYRHRVSPIPSDIYTVIQKYNVDLNDLQFNGEKPFETLEQLLFILPPQMNFLLPKCLQSIMMEGECAFFYPFQFDVDALAGIKYIYSEAILPEIDVKRLRQEFQQRSAQLTDSEQKRNKNRTKIFYAK